ncbi:glycoside hydrolase family 27 protein [Agrocybe pediades]|nr:glycoside hydrolase family 27 protein [Agrocybe pediades]
MLKLQSVYLALGLLARGVFAIDDGTASTPPMGWNPYNAFSCSTTEAMYKSAAQRLVNLGLSNLGYRYVNLDCGWQGKARNSSGGFTWDTGKIPNGIPALASYIHSLGLKFGVYSDGGVYSCDDQGGNGHYLGSLGHEASDAASFASWGADYLKYDNCFAVSGTDFVDYNPPFNTEDHMTAMRDALAATKRPIVFSICEWGVQDPARWPASSVGHSWRMSNDIGPPASWDNLFRIINQLVPITQFAQRGGWNDLDMLEVGNNGLTAAEQQTHFAFWAAAKSPLIISTDLTNPSSQTLSILSNTRIIGLNQDSLGRSISFKRRYTNDHDVWAGPLADGSTVAIVINWQNSARTLTFDLTDVGFKSANAVDLITGSSLGTLSGTYSASVAAHGSLVLKLTNGVASPARTFTSYAAGSASLSGGANTRVVNSTTVVGFVGNGGTLTFNNVDGGSAGGTKLLSFDYINADFTMGNTACSNCRNAYVSVNGGTAVQAQMPISAQNWNVVFSGYLLSMSGFKPGKVNTVTISNPSGYAPDFVKMGVAV